MATSGVRRSHSLFLALVLAGIAAALAAGNAPAADDGAWEGVPPVNGRTLPVAFHDSTGHRVFVFGGLDGAVRNDLWALDLDDSTWTEIVPPGPSPSPRRGHSASYDSARHRWLVFGGSEISGFNPLGARLDDVWAVTTAGTPAWTELAPAGAPPPAREGHTSVYDAANDRLLVFGGEGDSLLGDVWALDLSGTPAWSELTPIGSPPDPRVFHVALYDGARQRMLVFGGDTGSSPSDEVWALDLSSTPVWSQLAPSGAAPGGRLRAGALYDAALDRWLVFGGYDGSAVRDDVYALSLSGSPSWSEVAAGGASPGVRTGHAVVRDPVSGDMLVLCGGGSFELPHDAFALTLSAPETWVVIGGDPFPLGRLFHSAIFDSQGDRMIVFGGRNGPDLNDVWALDLAGAGPPAWEELLPAGTPPAPRVDHSAVYDPSRHRMIVFGGDAGAQENDTWELTLGATPAWTELATTGGPPPVRESHTAIVDPSGDRMIVFGGISGPTLLDDVWALDFATNTWAEIVPAGAPPGARRYHVAVYDPIGHRMLVYGGRDFSSPGLNDVWALSLGATPAWNEIMPAGPLPDGPLTHAAIFDPSRNRLVSFGGSYHNEVWALDLDGAPAWSELAPSGFPPTGRVEHAAIYDPVGDRMVAYAGHSGLAILADTWILDWSASTSVAGRPTDPVLRVQPTGFPNPARDEAAIAFTLPRRARTTLAVYDIRGRLVQTLLDGEMRAGEHAAHWRGRDESGRRVASGVYFARLEAGTFTATKKLVLIR